MPFMEGFVYGRKTEPGQVPLAQHFALMSAKEHQSPPERKRKGYQHESNDQTAHSAASLEGPRQPTTRRFKPGLFGNCSPMIRNAASGSR